MWKGHRILAFAGCLAAAADMPKRAVHAASPQSPLAEAAERERRRREAAASPTPIRKPQKASPAPGLPPQKPAARTAEPASTSGGALRSPLTLIYTGRSLGSLGDFRSQDEHELLTEAANSQHMTFKLVSHASWRAPGTSIFMPSDEPEGDELPSLIKLRAGAEFLGVVPALRSGTALLVQDPATHGPDLLGMMVANARAAADFPDLGNVSVAVYRAPLTRKKMAYFVEEEGAIFPQDAAMFEHGEMNRIDVGGASIFELPINLAQIGPRSTIVRGLAEQARATGGEPFIVDLGSRLGETGLDGQSRARLDWSALDRMGYQAVVPWEFEMGLGAEGLAKVAAEHPGIRLLATNVVSRSGALFEPKHVIAREGVTVGMIALVDPFVRTRLPRRVLEDFTFEDPVAAARRAVRDLRRLGATVVVALSNLSPEDNARVAALVPGIDLILADLHERLSPQTLTTTVELQDHERTRPGSPALVARGFSNGLGVGSAELLFPLDGGQRPTLRAIRHHLRSVTDSVPADAELARTTREERERLRSTRGAMLVPAFMDLEEVAPALRSFDEVAAQGRISKRMWEDFIARLVRRRGRAEVSLITPLTHFPPLLGKLHEEEVRQWLWTEETLVVLDLRGSEISEILREDASAEVVTSGFDRKTGKVMGRSLDENALYRIATTDLLFEGARFRAFEKARRVRRLFRPDARGGLESSRDGAAVTLREMVLEELRRIRGEGGGQKQARSVAALLSPDPAFETLSTFQFDRPTLFASFSEAYRNDGYQAVPESRIVAAQSSLLGFAGRFKWSRDQPSFIFDAGATMAYSKLSTTRLGGARSSVEVTDDLKVDFTIRPKTAGAIRAFGPFARAIFDTEFSPTRNTNTGVLNPRQAALSAVLGVLRRPGRNLRVVELGAVVETDLSRESLLAGVAARTELNAGAAGGRLRYRMRNDVTWFPYSRTEDPSLLGLRYNMIHEILFPLFDELSLSIAADAFVFRGVAESNRKPGMSVLFRIGLTYDRVWKPRYQPLF